MASKRGQLATPIINHTHTSSHTQYYYKKIIKIYYQRRPLETRLSTISCIFWMYSFGPYRRYLQGTSSPYPAPLLNSSPVIPAKMRKAWCQVVRDMTNNRIIFMNCHSIRILSVSWAPASPLAIPLALESINPGKCDILL